MAATNRPDVLDPALLRPGRFDRQVTVSLPDKQARKEILAVHAKNKVIDKSVTLDNLAKRTPGFSGADLENLLNEAALLTVRRNKKAITMAEIDEATDRVLMGPAKVTKKYTEKEKKLVAYHEAGHAVLGLKLDGANEVQKITIIPRGHAGGYTMMTPKEDTFNYTKKELLDSICGLLGGRVAEEITFNEVTTGAHDDFKKATNIARKMVTEYGMSSLGPMMLDEPSENTFLGRDFNKNKNFSDIVAHEIDEEMRSIINSCYEKSKKILKDNQKLLKLIAETLLEEETITKEQIDSLVENGKLDKEETKNFDGSKKGLVEFKNVSFRYPDADAELLTDITFTAEPGKTTAIIGSTGSGKSTIVNLIPRFYDVTGGELLIDGVNIKDVPQHELRKRIGFVPQKGLLFSGTIESNIKYGNPEMSDEQMKEAAKIAQATEFIEAKPDKYKSEIAQGGANVSGGQKQRLSIARAIAIDPEIFVFDDSFSALDLKTDSKLRAALATKTKDKTVIIVAQRVSTILNADQIIVLEEGKIVGIGTHQELMKKCDTYSQIALSQLSKEELE